MKKTLPLLLILGACATPMKDLYEQRDACMNTGCPDELHEMIDQREKQIERIKEQREYDKKSRCPSGTAEYCITSKDKGCRAAHKSKDDEFTCIGRYGYNNLF